MWLTRLALRNPVFILMMTIMVMVLGFVSLRRLSVDLFPDINIPIIRVATFYTGAGPGDIEKSITQPVERAVSAAPGVDRVESVSKQGVSVVSAWFNYGVNLDNAQFEVSQRVAQILNTLPPGIQQPFVLKFAVTNIPVVQIAIAGTELDEKQLYDLAYNLIEPQLERLPGVASATVGGGKIREIEVTARRDALRARGLGMLQLVNAVKSSNLLLPSGNLRTATRDYNVFTNTQVSQVRALKDVVVVPPSASSQQAVRVSDVAEVTDGTADQFEIVRVNGQRGVYLRVLKQPGANTIAVVDAVRQAIPRLRNVPSNVKLAISFDQSSYIRAAVSSLQHEAFQGGLLAVAVILFFLLSLRATAIVSLAIPISIVATFVLLYFTGQTLNVFTLGGLALGVGRLVDDSIVELENIHRHLAMGQKRRDAVLAAAHEVERPSLVSTITTIVETRIGIATSCAAARTASRRFCPIARCRWMFSNSTIESSTNRPTPSASPPSVNTLSVLPVKKSRTKVATIESGMATATMAVARRLTRKTRMTRMASRPPVTASCSSAFTAERM